MLLWDAVFIPTESRENMKGYSYSREDYLELLVNKYFTMDEILENPWCLSLPEEMVDERDFKAEQAIQIDYSIKLPDSFSLGEWIYKTNYQWAIGSCTSNSTSHGVQILVVKKNWVKPTTKNIITPDRKDLRTKMGHNPEKYEGGDYIEKAVSTALKEWIKTEEWGEAKFDAYATENFNFDDISIETIKRYLYNGNPIVWLLKWNKKMWDEISAWEIKTIPESTWGGHAVAVVGWDKWGLWFINSWKPNDWKWLKSRFYISNKLLKQLKKSLNFRYWVLYIENDAKIDPEYLKRKNVALTVLSALKKYYDGEPIFVRDAIVKLSKAYREAYPEINDELPL